MALISIGADRGIVDTGAAMLRVDHRGRTTDGSDGMLVVVDEALSITRREYASARCSAREVAPARQPSSTHHRARRRRGARIAQVVGHHEPARFSSATGAIALVTENEGFTGALGRSEVPRR
jgi:hypothetical protein